MHYICLSLYKCKVCLLQFSSAFLNQDSEFRFEFIFYLVINKNMLLTLTE